MCQLVVYILAYIYKLSLPPLLFWSWQGWAYILWSLSAIGIIYGGFLWQRNRHLTRLIATQKKELREMETQLFSKIYRKLSRSIAVIQGIARQIEASPADVIQVQKGSALIIRQSDALHNLVDQMEKQNELVSDISPLKIVRGNVVKYLQHIKEHLYEPARNKNVRLHFLPQEREVEINYDAERLFFIISGVLSYAIRLSPIARDVYLLLEIQRTDTEYRRKVRKNRVSSSEILQIQVRDRGPELNKNSKRPIIGHDSQDRSLSDIRQEAEAELTIARQLTTQLGGQLQIEINPVSDQGAIYTIRLPIDRTVPTEEDADLDMQQLKTASGILGRKDQQSAVQTSSGSDFLRRLNQTLEDNLSNADFGPQQLCQALQISRSHLHRRIKVHTGHSTSRYIRSFRLKRARELLLQSENSISEISYEVGFKSPVYFSQSFTKEFGISPSSFRE